MVFGLLIVYRTEVVRLIRRFKRGKIFGQEVEFGVDQFEVTATKAEEEAPNAPLPIPPATPPELDVVKQSQDQGGVKPLPKVTSVGSSLTFSWRIDPEENVLSDAAMSPRLGLVTLSGELEKTVRRILASSQGPETWERRSLPQMIAGMQLPENVRRGVTQFYAVRNKLVHGRNVDDEDVVRALDSGLKLLGALRALPHETHTVRFPAVEVFADDTATQPREIKAVVLDTTSPGNARRDVFPTRRQYREGQVLSWEWDTSRAWNESWYRDPDTNEVMKAWDSAAEFAGRPLDEIT
jgi:hypothetical protein